jgi:hypothetical protein
VEELLTERGVEAHRFIERAIGTITWWPWGCEVVSGQGVVDRQRGGLLQLGRPGLHRTLFGLGRRCRQLGEQDADLVGVGGLQPLEDRQARATCSSANSSPPLAQRSSMRPSR